MNTQHSYLTRKLLLAAALLVLFVMGAQAQNSIDRLVESYSAVGNCKFTSAVERNPQTGKVVKVVKVLEQDGLVDAKAMEAAFRNERNTGEYSENREGGKRTFTLLVAKPRQSRIYMLQVTGSGYGSKTWDTSMRTTVIVKNR